MRRRKLPLIWALIVLLIAQPLFPMGIVFAESNDDTSVTDDVYGSDEMSVTNAVYGQEIAPVQFKDVELYYTEDNGSSWIEYNGDIRLGLGDDVKLIYYWELPQGPEGHGVKEGDFYEFFLPEEFELFNLPPTEVSHF
jgi:uncharacterized surface anchored protein